MSEGNPMRRGAQRRRHRREHYELETEAEVVPELMTPEEEAYHEARREAERKVELTGKLARHALINLLLLVFLPPIGIIMLIVNAIRFGRPLYEQIVEPRVRERFLREEVEKRVREQLVQERQDLAGEHARSMQELSASIAHEIRNPITAAKSLVQQMGEDPRSSENIEYAKVALDELDRVERSVSHLLRFAREEDVKMSDMTMSDVIDAALETFGDRIAALGVDIHKELDADGAMRGDPEKLRRVIINLFGNALDALEEAGVGSPRVEIQAGENLAGTEVWVRIRDNGPGMEAEKVEKIFKPFYTSKAQGTGLGLAITKKLVDAHGGTIEATSRPGEGAEFLLTFPKNGVEMEAHA